MTFIPAFELGLWNAWIFMIWLLVTPIISSIIIKEKKVSKILRTSVPMKYDKTLNLISTGAVIIGFLYSIFLPLKLNTLWFYIGLLIFIFGFIFDLSVLFTISGSNPDKPFMKGP